MWLEKAWPYLKDNAKILIYVMAKECQLAHESVWDDAFEEYGY